MQYQLPHVMIEIFLSVTSVETMQPAVVSQSGDERVPDETFQLTQVY
jgi:hypothetical protein